VICPATSSADLRVSFTRSRASRSRSTSRRKRDGARRRSHRFDGDLFRKEMLLSGRDEIGLTLGYEAQIAEFERRHAREAAWGRPRAEAAAIIRSARRRQ